MFGAFGLLSAVLLTRKRRSNLVALLVILTIGVSAAASYFQDATDAFVSRATGSGDTGGGRVGTTFLGFTGFVLEAGMFGFGVGALHPAAANLVPEGETYWWISPIEWMEFEDEFSRILVELGIIGFGLYMIYRISLMIRSFQIAAGFEDEFRPAAVLSALMIASSLTTSFVYNVNENLWTWYFVGVLYAVATASNEAGYSELSGAVREI